MQAQVEPHTPLRHTCNLPLVTILIYTPCSSTPHSPFPLSIFPRPPVRYLLLPLYPTSKEGTPATMTCPILGYVI